MEDREADSREREPKRARCVVGVWVRSGVAGAGPGRSYVKLIRTRRWAPAKIIFIFSFGFLHMLFFFFWGGGWTLRGLF